MAEQFKSLHPIKYYRDCFSNGIRPDGRAFDSYRPVVVNVDSIDTADSSAIAKIGNTIVICGIKAELCKPHFQRVHEGFFIPNVDLPPLCSNKFKPGPPSDEAQIATQLIDDIVKNSKCIDLKDLCLVTDTLAWCLYADLICLDYDGSLIDCCLIALLAALKTLKLPQVEYEPLFNCKSVNTDERKLIKVYNTPVSQTFAIFDEKIILYDPTIEEEDLATSLVTIVIKDSDLCLIHKPGGNNISEEELLNLIKLTKNKYLIISKLISTVITGEDN